LGLFLSTPQQHTWNSLIQWNVVQFSLKNNKKAIRCYFRGLCFSAVGLSLYKKCRYEMLKKEKGKKIAIIFGYRTKEICKRFTRSLFLSDLHHLNSRGNLIRDQHLVCVPLQPKLGS